MTGRPLAGFERIPPGILEFVANHAGIPAPQIATLRAIYRRRRRCSRINGWLPKRSAGGLRKTVCCEC